MIQEWFEPAGGAGQIPQAGAGEPQAGQTKFPARAPESPARMGGGACKSNDDL